MLEQKVSEKAALAIGVVCNGWFFLMAILALRKVCQNC
jgi:hypothetical protein